MAEGTGGRRRGCAPRFRAGEPGTERLRAFGLRLRADVTGTGPENEEGSWDALGCCSTGWVDRGHRGGHMGGPPGPGPFRQHGLKRSQAGHA